MLVSEYYNVNRLAARETVLLAHLIEDPLRRRVPLHYWPLLVVFQNGVDDADPPSEKRLDLERSLQRHRP